MLRDSNSLTVTTGPLMAAIMLKWPLVKMSLTPREDKHGGAGKV